LITQSYALAGEKTEELNFGAFKTVGGQIGEKMAILGFNWFKLL
jgi:hypothetical protein